MIGSYVRIVTSPYITGKIKAARFDKGGGVFLFHPDPQCVGTFPETWLPNSAFEECVPPKDTQAANKDKPTGLPLKYFRMAVARYTRMGTIMGARFDAGCVSFLFHQDPRLAYAFPNVWLLETELEPCTQPTDEEIAVMNCDGLGASQATNADQTQGDPRAQVLISANRTSGFWYGLLP